MNLLSILLQAPAGGSQWSGILMMVVIVAIFYFFMIRPQQKKQKEIQKFRNSIVPGTDVVTAGGIYGKVKEVNELDNTLMVEIASGVKIVNKFMVVLFLLFVFSNFFSAINFLETASNNPFTYAPLRGVL